MIDDNYAQDKDLEVQSLWINGELDLHTFRPSEIKSLIPDKHPQVLTFGLADQSEGGWGATIVHLHSSNNSH